MCAKFFKGTYSGIEPLGKTSPLEKLFSERSVPFTIAQKCSVFPSLHLHQAWYQNLTNLTYVRWFLLVFFLSSYYSLPFLLLPWYNFEGLLESILEMHIMTFMYKIYPLPFPGSSSTYSYIIRASLGTEETMTKSYFLLPKHSWYAAEDKHANT